MALGAQDSYKFACELVKGGLEGGTIKLSGPSANTSVDTAKSTGERDAAYLDTLIKSLIKTLST